MKNLSKEEMFEPLEKYVPKRLWDSLTFMGTHDDRIFLYKHDETRRYINVDENGQFYFYTGNDIESYIKIDKNSAIQNLDVVDMYTEGWFGGDYSDAGLFNDKNSAERGFTSDKNLYDLFSRYKGAKISISVKVLEE